MTLSSHHYCAELAVEFLLRVHLIVLVPEGIDYYTGFGDYIFPRILMPNRQPNLVVIFIPGSLRALLTQSGWEKRKLLTLMRTRLKRTAEDVMKFPLGLEKNDCRKGGAKSLLIL